MRRRKVEAVCDVVPALLRELGLETPLNEARAINAWEIIVGERVAKATGNVKIYNQVMFVEVASPALRNNLFMQRAMLVRKINEYVGADVISDIRFK